MFLLIKLLTRIANPITLIILLLPFLLLPLGPGYNKHMKGNLSPQAV